MIFVGVKSGRIVMDTAAMRQVIRIWTVEKLRRTKVRQQGGQGERLFMVGGVKTLSEWYSSQPPKPIHWEPELPHRILSLLQDFGYQSGMTDSVLISGWNIFLSRQRFSAVVKISSETI